MINKHPACRNQKDCSARHTHGALLCRACVVALALTEPERRHKLSEAGKRYVRSPEGRAKMSAAMKTVWADPVWRDQMVAKRKQQAKRANAHRLAAHDGERRT
jgi:hypothetical protein